MVNVNFDISALCATVDEAKKKGIMTYINEDLKPLSDDKCPFLTGALVGTGKAEETDDGGRLSYGDGLPYAAKQFFDDSLVHANGKESHWTERAYVETQDRLPERIDQAIKEALG